MPRPLWIAAFLAIGLPSACSAEAGPQPTGSPPAAAAQGAPSQTDLAKELANPIASLISVPFQNNFDWGIGRGALKDSLFRYTLNVQPVIPFSISKDWNVVSRTILPIVYLEDPGQGAGSQFGTGDTLQSFFFSPKKPTKDGIIWGVGPAFLLPTASETLLGGEKFGLGPTIVALKQENGWTYGALANQVWSVAGDSDRQDVSAEFLQPFLAYTTKKAVTYTLSSESTYNWKSEEWAVPVILQVGKVLKLGGQLVSAGFGVKYWPVTNPSSPSGWGARLNLVLLYPRVKPRAHPPASR